MWTLFILPLGKWVHSYVVTVVSEFEVLVTGTNAKLHEANY